jgi:predicted MFS family arabinose efflux permease
MEDPAVGEIGRRSMATDLLPWRRVYHPPDRRRIVVEEPPDRSAGEADRGPIDDDPSAFPNHEDATGERSPAEDGGPGSTLEVVGVIVGLFLLSTGGAAYEIAPASVLPVIRESRGIGPTAAGWLVSVMFATAVVTSVPVGAVLDRVSVRWSVGLAGGSLLIAGVWGWSAALEGAYWSLLASRAFGGVAFITVWNAGADLVGKLVPTRFRATAVGAFTASGPAGFALGQFGSPVIDGVLGWPAIFPAFAGLGAIGLVPFLGASRRVGVALDAEVPGRAALYRLFTNRRAWTLYGLCFLAYALYLFLNSWLPSYLSEGLGIDLGLGGLVTALFPAVGVVARTSGGAVSDRLFDGRRRPVVLGAFAVATPAAFGFLVTRDLAAIVVLVVVAGVAVQMVIGLLFSYVAEIVAASVTTTAVATLTSVGLLGAFLAPIATGEVIARAGYRPAFLLAALLTTCGLGLAVWSPDTG